MKHLIAVGPRGYIDGADHRKALGGAPSLPQASVVRFYFGPHTWMDVKFSAGANGEPCLEVRAMSASVPSLSVQPSSGNTIYLVPGK